MTFVCCIAILKILRETEHSKEVLYDDYLEFLIGFDFCSHDDEPNLEAPKLDVQNFDDLGPDFGSGYDEQNTFQDPVSIRFFKNLFQMTQHHLHYFLGVELSLTA